MILETSNCATFYVSEKSMTRQMQRIGSEQASLTENHYYVALFRAMIKSDVLLK